jgi:hypothetical protein
MLSLVLSAGTTQEKDDRTSHLLFLESTSEGRPSEPVQSSQDKAQTLNPKIPHSVQAARVRMLQGPVESPWGIRRGPVLSSLLGRKRCSQPGCTPGSCKRGLEQKALFWKKPAGAHETWTETEGLEQGLSQKAL